MLLGSLKNRGRGGGVLHQPRGWGMGQRSISISMAALYVCGPSASRYLVPGRPCTHGDQSL